MFSLSATSLFEFPASKSRSTSISLSVSSMFGFSAICTAGADVEMIFGVLPSNFSTSGIRTVSSINVWIFKSCSRSKRQFSSLRRRLFLSSNGRYFIQAKAINNLALTGEYNVFITFCQQQHDQRGEHQCWHLR